ncbi:hypothetical protein EG863_15275, partial [Enterococcus faecalis]
PAAPQAPSPSLRAPQHGRPSGPARGAPGRRPLVVRGLGGLRQILRVHPAARGARVFLVGGRHLRVRVRLGLGRVDIVHTLVAHRGSLHPPHPLRRYVKQRIDEGVGVCPKHGEHGLGHALAVHPVLLDNLDDVVHDGLADGVALDDRRDLPIKPVEDGDSGAGARPRPGALPFGLLVAHLLGIVFTPDDRE